MMSMEKHNFRTRKPHTAESTYLSGRNWVDVASEKEFLCSTHKAESVSITVISIRYLVWFFFITMPRPL